MFRHRHCTGLLWASLALTVAAAPQSPRARAAEVPAVPSADPTTSADDVVLYDQRQNGTENVRISLSDLKVVLAPADGLFEIMSMAGAQLFNSELFNNAAAASEHRPTAIECTGFKCNSRHRQAGKKSVHSFARVQYAFTIGHFTNSRFHLHCDYTQCIAFIGI